MGSIEMDIVLTSRIPYNVSSQSTLRRVTLQKLSPDESDYQEGKSTV
jgi:hypothetical protein